MVSLAAIATLAVAISATTAVFSIIDKVLIQSLPIQRPSKTDHVQLANPTAGSYSGADSIAASPFTSAGAS
jgi:hypothetical protein